ncbi:MAG TPA: hypothetical protein VJT13_23405 [Xanthobacteraceae bacterium]|nr:hypothetical protein [Xanthobacteraceae bacterium]
MPTFGRLMFCAAALLASAGLAAAQPDQNPPIPLQPPAVIEASPPPEPAPVTRLPTPAESLNAIGRFFGGATDAAGDVAKGVGDAAGTVARLPLTNVVTGKQMCINAPNGAPDCVTASETLCRAKGYQRGASLDITSAYRCPAAFWAERREPNDKDCVSEAFVSKAVCQ